MNSLQKLIFPLDLLRLPKDVLEDIAGDINETVDSNVYNLVDIITKNMQKETVQGKLLESADSLLFAGKTSVAWYPLRSEDAEFNIKEALTESLSVNVFEQQIVPTDEEIAKTPKIIAATKLENGSVLIRLISKKGYSTSVKGVNVVREQQNYLNTVIINQEQKFMEVRGDSQSINKVAEVFGSRLQSKIEPLNRFDILGPFNNSIEELAEALEGQLIETISTPEALIEEMSKEQLGAIMGIFEAIDEYFKDGDLANLEGRLKGSKVTLEETGEDYLSLPLFAIVTAGMNKIGLASSESADVRLLPLFKWLSPQLKNQGAFIKFPVDEGGFIVYYTIKVGINTKTIHFVSRATEAAIKRVRDVVFKI